MDNTSKINVPSLSIPQFDSNGINEGICKTIDEHKVVAKSAHEASQNAQAAFQVAMDEANAFLAGINNQ